MTEQEQSEEDAGGAGLKDSSRLGRTFYRSAQSLSLRRSLTDARLIRASRVRGKMVVAQSVTLS